MDSSSSTEKTGLGATKQQRDKNSSESTNKNEKDESSSEGWGSDDSDYIGPLRESTYQTVVQECAKQAIRQYNAEQADEPNYFFLIKVLESHGYFNIGDMHYVKILMGKSIALKTQLTPDEFEQCEGNFVETSEKNYGRMLQLQRT